MKKILTSFLIAGSVLVATPFVVEAKTTASPYRPTAICRDGTYSYSAHRKGTCSWHKGVRIWLK